VKRWIGVVFLLLVLVCGGVWGYIYSRPALVPRGEKIQFGERVLDKYSFQSLRKRAGMASELGLGDRPVEVDLRRKEENFESKVFYYQSEGKKISGLINRPLGFSENKKYPLIVMIRGYAEKEGYYSGYGTFRVADELTKKGYVSVSMDFLGYGESEGESEDMLEARFEKARSVLDLLESVKNLSWVDRERIGIWGHSNGGQIAISVLEITGGKYPTVLWAPVSKGFPEGMVVYASDLDDGGEAVRLALAEFEKEYDSRLYSTDWYLLDIRAPILVIQGDQDEWVGVDWQEDLVGQLKQLGKEVELVVYKGADHNLAGSWNEAVSETVAFFEKKLL
jgi:dipeptidyl aminopeptidase/acylaminoacyl peptidase